MADRSSDLVLPGIGAGGLIGTSVAALTLSPLAAVVILMVSMCLGAAVHFRRESLEHQRQRGRDADLKSITTDALARGARLNIRSSEAGDLTIDVGRSDPGADAQ